LNHSNLAGSLRHATIYQIQTSASNQMVAAKLAAVTPTRFMRRSEFFGNMCT
jgi:hypothetical protein